MGSGKPFKRFEKPFKGYYLPFEIATGTLEGISISDYFTGHENGFFFAWRLNAKKALF